MQNISINQIDVSDRRFCISYPVLDDELLLSVGKIGIIEPLIILARQPYTIVTGFKRLEAALKLGFTAIPCISIGMDGKNALLAAIHSNLGRKMNIVEKANCVDKMFIMGFPEETISETMAMLSLEFYDRVVERMRTLANADDSLKDFILKKSLSMQNIEALLRFSPNERDIIVEILNTVHTTESMMREILQMLSIIKLKNSDVDFSLMAGADNAYELKKRLKHIVNPILSTLEAELGDIKSRCALPPGIDIKVDPFFEKEYIDILIRAKHPDEIRTALSKIESLLDAGHIRSIFELTNY